MRRFHRLPHRLSRIASVFAISAALSGTLTGCSLDHLLNGDDQTEGGVIDPGTLATYQGALTVYNAARGSMLQATKSLSLDVGLFTDELAVNFGSPPALDARAATIWQEEGVISDAYGHLQMLRNRSAQAADLLRRYGRDASGPLIGNAYAMQAHALVMLAEVYCSGVPLTETPFEGNLKYTPGLSTTTLLERAVALFDTAYQYGKDSVPIATFAQVGKGRALLSLGRYAEAAAAVVDVAPGSVYRLSYSAQQFGVPFWATSNPQSPPPRILSPEGINGLQWLAESPELQDKRLPVLGDPARQQKFIAQTTTFTLANDIQALMITAEAQLQPANSPQGAWLATLNSARATLGLTPLADPGTASGRIDMLFEERAFWFYLTGQRLGDMRRLVRNYGRFAEQIYPVGAHPAGDRNVVTYGIEYVFVPPRTERDFNPLFTGCIDKRP